MGKWKCSVCGYVYDEAKEGTPFAELPADWTCPQCGAPKSAFNQIAGEEKARGVETTVADKIVEQLVAYGVDRVFGIPGNSNLPLTDAIRRHPKIELILVRHEESAAFMASAHGKLTNTIGVCMSIAGPGATNLITGIVDSATDRSPVLALLGQVPQPFLGSESLQEIPESDIFKSFCVYSEMLVRPAQALRILNLAIKKAYSCDGPSALSLPTDVLAEPLDDPVWPPENHLFRPDLAPANSVHEAAELISKAKRPLIFIGWGARCCGAEVLDLARHIGAPIATTSRAKGVLPESDPLVLRVLGSIGNRFAPKVVTKSDLIVILGSGFRQRNLVPDVDKIQVDIDAARIGKTFPVKLGIVGDAMSVVKALRDLVPAREMDPEFAGLVRSARDEHDALMVADAANTNTPVHPGAVIQAMKRQLAKDAIVCSDVGDHTYWFYKRFVCEEHTTLLCANMAGMGFGVPAAIACQFAEPKRQVVCITGDGGFGMLGMEFTTAVHNNLPITVVLFNDSRLKNIGKEMDENNFPKYRIYFPNPNFADLATSAGGLGIRVEEPAKLDEALRNALDSPLPALVEVLVDPETYIRAVRRV